VRVPNLRALASLLTTALALSTVLSVVAAFAADTLEGRVFGADAPFAKSTVSLCRPLICYL